MVKIIAGALLAAIVLIVCCCVRASGEADRRMEDMMDHDGQKKQ